MTDEGHLPEPLSTKRILVITGVGVLVAAIVLLGAILPAEFNKDPLGIGKVTGLSKLWSPGQEVVGAEGSAPLAREYQTPWRTDTIEIPLRADMGLPMGNDLEYKVHMQKGGTLIYSWEVPGVANPAEFYFDFHGHTPQDPKTGKITVSTYKQATGTKASGALTAPFDGIHGWYLQNQSVNPVVVKLKLAGFYTLVPAGQPGNEYGVIANVPAAEAFGPPPPE